MWTLAIAAHVDCVRLDIRNAQHTLHHVMGSATELEMTVVHSVDHFVKRSATEHESSASRDTNHPFYAHACIASYRKTKTVCVMRGEDGSTWA